MLQQISLLQNANPRKKSARSKFMIDVAFFQQRELDLTVMFNIAY